MTRLTATGSNVSLGVPLESPESRRQQLRRLMSKVSRKPQSEIVFTRTRNRARRAGNSQNLDSCLASVSDSAWSAAS